MTFETPIGMWRFRPSSLSPVDPTIAGQPANTPSA